MTWTAIVRQGLTLPQLQGHIAPLNFNLWKPSKIVWHNTAAPTLAQWRTSAAADRQAGRASGITRINNLERFFRDQQKWSSAPQAFVADDLVWLFTPFTKKGTHTPSWNGESIGIEMIGDFSHEDDDAGPGLNVRKNTVALTALLCEKLGLSPEIGDVTVGKNRQGKKIILRTTGTIFLHKQDPLTDHDCPGKDVADDHASMVQEVREYMGQGGETDGQYPDDDAKPTAPLQLAGVVFGVAENDWLNLRARSSASGAFVAKLKNGIKLVVMTEAMNGTTRWFYVKTESGQQGWVAARYVKEG